jgi:hypothetical protein
VVGEVFLSLLEMNMDTVQKIKEAFDTLNPEVGTL